MDLDYATITEESQNGPDLPIQAEIQTKKKRKEKAK